MWQPHSKSAPSQVSAARFYFQTVTFVRAWIDLYRQYADFLPASKGLAMLSQSKHWSGGCRVCQTCSAAPVTHNLRPSSNSKTEPKSTSSHNKQTHDLIHTLSVVIHLLKPKMNPLQSENSIFCACPCSWGWVWLIRSQPWTFHSKAKQPPRVCHPAGDPTHLPMSHLFC